MIWNGNTVEDSSLSLFDQDESIELMPMRIVVFCNLR